MTRKSFGYGAACYYAGKLVGRCTLADAQGYEQLMKACGGNAARVLQEYAYFSPELRGILEKVAAVQAKESRAAGIFQSPRLSPWGDVQTSDTRDEKSRTFSSNSRRSHILRTSSRSIRLILSSIVSLAVSLKWTRTI